MQQNKEYKSVFKSTFLFSFVQIIRLMVGIVKNKVAAIILGPSGMGIMGVFNTTITFIKIGTGLGIDQSAVRDVSEANSCGDRARFSRVISLTNKIVLFTALLGFGVTIVFSPFLSEYGFGNKDYTVAFILLSIAVAFDIYVDNQLAILKGMRQLYSLAKASVIGSIVALITGVPLFIIFKEKGIVPSIIVSAFATLAVSIYFVRRISYDKISLKPKEVICEGKSMVTMGISLMLVSFLAMACNYIIIAYIRQNGGLDDVGIYAAGTTIITSYFGIVINAMTTDYYPRISAINSDNIKLKEAVNQQSEVGLVLIFPLAVLFLYLTRIVIRILYSDEFILSVDYTDYAMLGAIIMICSRSISMVLLAKQNTKVFLTLTICLRLVILVTNIVLYKFYGLLGLGISYCFSGVLDVVICSCIMKYLYNIKFNKRVFLNLNIILLVCIGTIFVRRQDSILSYVLGGVILIFSCFYSFLYMKNIMGINLIDSFIARLFNRH